MTRPPPTPSIESDVLTKAAEVIKCLGHPLRLRLLEALEHGEKSVTELQAHSGATQAAVSQQLATMRARRVVECRRDGAHVYYHIIEPKVMAVLACIRSCDLPRR